MLEKTTLLIRTIKNKENPQKKLTNAFGTPIQVMKSYYDTVDSQYLIKKIYIKKIIIASCVIVVFTALFYFAFQTYTLQKAYDEFKAGIPTDYEETIEEIN